LATNINKNGIPEVVGPAWQTMSGGDEKPFAPM
jgi:hypothetical protein